MKKQKIEEQRFKQKERKMLPLSFALIYPWSWSQGPALEPRGGGSLVIRRKLLWPEETEVNMRHVSYGSMRHVSCGSGRHAPCCNRMHAS